VVTPPPITRNGASEAARTELSKAIYHRYDDPWWLRVLRFLGRWVRDVFDAAAAHAPGGAAGLVALVVLAVLIVVAIRVKVGPLRRSARAAGAVFGGRPLTAAEHRAAAERAAGEGRWADAVRERMRAVVRELEERGVLDPRPGRTADEVAREASRLLPAHAGLLRDAATTFDEVVYGGRPGSAEAERAVRAADDAVRSGRLVVAGP
jgi:hypothetical protein